MPAVSQALVDFANHHRQEAAPGIEVVVTPRYRATIQPDFPIAGPNNVGWIRCKAGEADEVIREARAIFAARHLPLMWTLDPEAEPSDFAQHLAKHGIIPDPHGAESQVMVMPIDATVEGPAIEGLEIRDALVDLETFRMADGAAQEAFGQEIPSPLQGRGSGSNQLVPSSSRLRAGAGKNEYSAMQERRRLNFRAAGNRYWLLATMHGEPAGAAGMSLFPPAGAILQGGSVRASFRGRGIYRAMVAARHEIARRAGAGGLAVWGGDMSAPILTALGFQKVGWRRFYLDTSTG